MNGSSSVYRPLAAEDFRLLHVLPGEGDQLIHAHLHHAKLSDHERTAYETVSYAWGDPTPVAEMTVNDVPILVPAKTEMVLRRIRLPDRERVVWIDAVCINQDDVDERSAQVASMGSIYSRSLCNLVYLGVLNDDVASRMLRTVEFILQDARQATDDFKSLRATLSPSGPLKEEHDAGHFISEVDDGTVMDILESPLLRRLWIVQEIVLAPHNVALLGSFELGFLDLLRALRWYGFLTQRASLKVDLRPAAIAGFICATNLFDFVDREHGHYAGYRVGLAALLRCGTIFCKTKPRDGVYAILGLLPEDQVALLQPNYDKPLAEILAIAMRTAIDDLQSLELFRQIYHRDGELESSCIPSWAVRVDREWDAQFDAHDLPGYHGHPKWGGMVQLSHGKDANATIVAVRGLIIGNVVDLMQPLLTS